MKVIDALYQALKKRMGIVNKWIHSKIGVNVAKYTLLSTTIVVWMSVAFLELAKSYTWEVGIALGIITLGVILHDLSNKMGQDKSVDKGRE